MVFCVLHFVCHKEIILHISISLTCKICSFVLKTMKLRICMFSFTDHYRTSNLPMREVRPRSHTIGNDSDVKHLQKQVEIVSIMICPYVIDFLK